MTQHATSHLLTINTGSSSLKAALYQMDDKHRRDLSLEVDRIGQPNSHMRITDADGVVAYDQAADYPHHRAALEALFAWMHDHSYANNLAAVGHRVVHGGPSYCEPAIVTTDMVAALHNWIPLDPEHLPQALDAIDVVGRTYPSIPQVACFDTAFHRHMPRVARLYALPRDVIGAGIVRYGFHGLSYESIMEQLWHGDGAAADGLIVIAHLGNGASMAAVRQGQGIDTTMGLTPTGGLVMGTRSGDLDPGVVLYLLERRHQNSTSLRTLLNDQCGLLGVSGISADMRDLLEREADDPHAAEAIALFCYQAQKFVGALTAVLGGLETLIFTGGIGEHAAPVRERICAGLNYLGIDVDPARNGSHASIISRDGARVTVRVMQTDEDAVIAHHTYTLLVQKGASGVTV